MFKFKKSMSGVAEESFECSCCGSMENQPATGAAGCSSLCGSVSDDCCGPVSDSKCCGSEVKLQNLAESNGKGSCGCSC